jgi:hypothetical protein
MPACPSLPADVPTIAKTAGTFIMATFTPGLSRCASATRTTLTVGMDFADSIHGINGFDQIKVR